MPKRPRNSWNSYPPPRWEKGDSQSVKVVHEVPGGYALGRLLNDKTFDALKALRQSLARTEK